MTIHMFYKYPPDGFVQQPVLYAWTTDKSIRDRFMKERDMTKFKYVKEKLSGKKEVSLFKDTYHKFYLNVFGLYTKSPITSNKTRASVLGTVEEENRTIIDCDKIVFNELKDKLIDSKILKSKYIKALDTLLYYKFYIYFKRQNENEMDDWYSAYGPSKSFVNMELIEGHGYDELRVFLKLFGNTFK